MSIQFFGMIGYCLVLEIYVLVGFIFDKFYIVVFVCVYEEVGFD